MRNQERLLGRGGSVSCQNLILHCMLCILACMLSCVCLFVIPWTVAHKAPLSMRFSRQEYWSGLPFSPLGFLPRDRTCVSCISSLFTGRFFTTVPAGKPMFGSVRMQKWIQDMVPHSSSPHGLTQPPRTHQGFRF